MYSLKKISCLPGLKQLPYLAEVSLIQIRNASSYDHNQKYGEGGRLSFNGHVVTMLGATGMIGRKVTNRLCKLGTQLVVPYRGSEFDVRPLRLMGDLGQIVFLDYDVRDYESLLKVMSHSTCVVNMVGRDYATRNFTMENTLVDAASSIAKAAAECGVPRLIHMSHLCASEDSPSLYMQLKAQSERAVSEAFPNVTIMRAAQAYGEEDNYLNRYAWLRMFPLVPFPSNGWLTIKQPVYGADVAQAVVNAVLDNTTDGKLFELAGPEPYYLYDLMEFSLRLIKVNLRTVPCPLALYKLIGRVLQLQGSFLNWYPKVSEDLVVREYLSESLTEGALTFEDLGIVPANLNQQAIKILRYHRNFYNYDEMLLDDDVIKPVSA